MQERKYIIGFFGFTILFLIAYYVPYLYFSGPYIEDDVRYEEDAYSVNPVLWESGNVKQAAIENDDIVEKIIYEYYIILKENHIEVYKEDKKTLYFKTSIRTDSLSNEEITELSQGIYILDSEELYAFLESHTS